MPIQIRPRWTRPRPDTAVPPPSVFRPDSPKRYLVGDLCELLETYLKPDEVKEVYQAYLFGAEAHEGQVRSSGEPYIFHPIEVARILAEMHLDHHSLVAAMLHDVIEDTDSSKKQIAKQFGKDVANLVDGVSKIDRMQFTSREEAQAENFRKMLMAMARDIRVILVKLADRIHNMRTIGHLGRDKQRFIARQTLDIYAPIAKRLGLHQWCQELQDLCLQTLYPMRYRAILEAVKKRQGNRKAIINKIQGAIEARLKSEGIKARVFGREKNVYSIYQKMRSKLLSFDDVYDVFGFRIVVDGPDTCYRVLGAVHNLYRPIPGRFKDYIAIPKANGYQSLHSLLSGPYGQPFEVQIRSREMHCVAEAGVAAHWHYKSDNGSGSPDSATGRTHELARRWVVELLNTQRDSGSSKEFLEHLKIDLFPDEVYVFTPKGDIKKFPRQSTVLDFAYAVHTDVGNRCVGARVNSRPVPIRTRLRNGDHVEIITSHNAVPHPSWLNYVFTSRARATIRGRLKTQRRKEAIRLGRRQLKKAAKIIGLGKNSDADKKVLLAKLKLDSWDDLLADIGMGNRLALVVARQIAVRGGGVSSVGADEKDSPPLTIRGTEGLAVTLARCCRPIPGDPAVGFMSPGKGIVVHIEDCRNATEIRKHPENWIDINWERSKDTRFPVAVLVEAENRRGVLARLAAVIAEADANIENVTLTERAGTITAIEFIIEVRSRHHLAAIMRDLRAQPLVVRINRVRN